MKVSFEKPSEVITSPVVEVVSTVTACDVKGAVTSQIVDITPVSDVPSSAPVSTAIATANTTVAVNDGRFLYDDQEIELDDIRLPRINVVQKVGPLSNIFESGQIVLDQELVIHTPANLPKEAGNPPLQIVILGFKKLQFAEKVEGGLQGLLLKSEEAVVANGGTTDYKEWATSLQAVKDGVVGARALKRFEKLATALVLIECPAHLAKADEDHISFPHECDGKFFALALWSMKGAAYTNGAKIFFTARRMGHLRNGYADRGWSFTTKLEAFKTGNFAFVPVLRPTAASTPGLKQFICGFLQNS